MNTTAIAQHLNIATEAITKIEEWATVLWVKFQCGCKFVSKKVIKMRNEVFSSKVNYASDEKMEAFFSIFLESVPENQKEMMAEAWELALNKGDRMFAISTADYSPEVNVINKPAIIASVQSFLVKSVGREKFRELAQKHSV